MTSLAGFTVRPDEQCQRGLHLLYSIPRGTDLAGLEEALSRVHDDRLLSFEESWRGRKIRRVVLQFRFEVRFGVRDNEVSFFFRATSPDATRKADREKFEAVLVRALPMTGPIL